MDLANFMDHIGARPAAVARGSGVPISTVMRIRDKERTPDGITIARLNRWADDMAKKLGLKTSERLSWDYLCEVERPPAGRAA